MNELVQPYLQTVLQALVSALALIVIAAVGGLRSKAEGWIETRTTVQQREKLHLIAKEGMALAEAVFKGAGGEAKLQEAEKYVLDHLADIGLNLTSTEIRAAIEKAVLEQKK
ncbi:phage holin [Paenibacillus caseinilyticus]|uniref:phage holin n=1 Tax=Paenibacillus caseinilyticus TaxID=3098138 RepID=UPI0022B85966|nr:phage holin [Paenibacillus caseinilyticus]MCZ8518902.1 phage holin [Paenibacillus caseinilyticus]